MDATRLDGLGITIAPKPDGGYVLLVGDRPVQYESLFLLASVGDDRTLALAGGNIHKIVESLVRAAVVDERIRRAVLAAASVMLELARPEPRLESLPVAAKTC